MGPRIQTALVLLQGGNLIDGSIIVDAIKSVLDQLFTPLINIISEVLSKIAEFTWYIPHLPLNKPLDILARPSTGVWPAIYDFHFNTGVPIGVSILITVWFARKAGVAMTILDAEDEIKSNRNLLVGIVMVYISYYIAVLYLGFANAVVTLIAPSTAELTGIAGNIGLTGGGVAALFIYFNISVNSFLIILIILINVLRIVALLALPMLISIIMAFHYARIPIITQVTDKFGRSMASTALWALPVAGGWRVTAVLLNADAGILETVTPSSGIGVEAVDPIITTAVFMIPLIVGIVTPLFMSNISQLYYFSKIAGLSFGKYVGSSGGSGGSGSITGGAGGGPTDSNPRIGSQNSRISGGADPTGGGDGSTSFREGLGTAKDIAPGFDENKEYVDWDNVDRTKKLGAKVAGGASGLFESAKNIDGPNVPTGGDSPGGQSPMASNRDQPGDDEEPGDSNGPFGESGGYEPDEPSEAEVQERQLTEEMDEEPEFGPGDDGPSLQEIFDEGSNVGEGPGVGEQGTDIVSEDNGGYTKDDTKVFRPEGGDSGSASDAQESSSTSGGSSSSTTQNGVGSIGGIGGGYGTKSVLSSDGSSSSSARVSSGDGPNRTPGSSAGSQSTNSSSSSSGPSSSTSASDSSGGENSTEVNPDESETTGNSVESRSITEDANIFDDDGAL